MKDKIIIRDLTVNCIIGVNADERVNKQNVTLNIVVYTDLSAAGISDNIADALDYFALRNRIAEHLECSGYFLLEKMAEKVAEICLDNPQAVSVEVTVDKPAALKNCRSVAVQIRRGR